MSINKNDELKINLMSKVFNPDYYSIKTMLNTWFHFDNESKFDDLVKFTNGAVFKDSNGFCLKHGNKIWYFNVGDYIGKNGEKFLVLQKTHNNLSDREVSSWLALSQIGLKSYDNQDLPDFLKKPKPIRTQDELDNERLTEIVDAIVRYRKTELAVPTEWIQEYNTIIERIKNNPK